MQSTVGKKSFLVPLSGPPLDAVELAPRSGGIVIGRNDQCDICMPADAEKVSRFHARFDFDGSRWHISDMGSRWGTFVNGIKLQPHVDTLLSDGDLIRITPWTFTLSPTARRRGIQASDDMAQTMVRTVVQETGRPLADTMLALLLESAGAIHAATDERQLAELVLDAAIRGTGLQNAAMLRPLDADATIEIVASRFAQAGGNQGVAISRSLIRAASDGAVAELDGGLGDISQSIVQLRINSAICVPLMLGGTVASYLYLDSRGTLLQGLRPGASAFCAALGKIASLALANLKRVDMERREAVMRAELSAAAAAQQWIMPRREGRFGVFTTIGESRPGQLVGGDFFDIIPLDEHRLAVTLGDVSGKGVSASVLMTATQGFLHAVLRETGDPRLALEAVNRFVNPRRPEGKFVTAWVGVFDASVRTLTYVDAGHSYALLRRRDTTIVSLDEGDGLPIGVEPEYAYSPQVVSFEGGDRVIVVSDGIIEQFSGKARVQFGVAGVTQLLVGGGDDDVAAVFQAVISHAGSSQLSDDATAVLVKWAGTG